MEHSLTSDQLTVTIKTQGAEINSVKNKNGVEFIWEADKNVWPRHAPVLFPIVGRLKNDSYTFNGSSYKMSQHGFARDREFVCIHDEADKLIFELKSDEQSLAVYPFEFVFRIIYRLHGNTLETTYQVKNPGNKTLFFSVGAHPGFRCPLLPDEKFEDYYLEFEHDTLMQTSLENGLRSATTKITPLVGKKLFLSAELFNNDALVFENHQINHLSLVSSVTGHRISVESVNWPYYGIWSKKGCTSFVCLEPWFGITDDEESTGELDKKDGIIPLSPHSEFNCSFNLSFH